MKTKLGHLIIASLISLSVVFSTTGLSYAGGFVTKKSTYVTTSASGFNEGPITQKDPNGFVHFEVKEDFDLKKNSPVPMSKEAFDQKNQPIFSPDYEIVIATEENYNGYDIPYYEQQYQPGVTGLFERKNPVKTFTVFFKIFFGPNETDWFLITDSNDCPISEFTKQSSDNYDYFWFKVKPNHALYTAYYAELVMSVWDGSKVRTHIFKLACTHSVPAQ